MNIFWFIPTHGDSRYLGTSKGARQVDHAYMKQIAVAVDNLGYAGVLIPTGRSCEDPWITAASLIDATKQLKFLVALRPGITTPALAARMAATFDRLSNGRILLNLVTGGDEQELKGDGLYEDHSTRYQTASEYVKIWREILTRSHTGESFTFMANDSVSMKQNYFIHLCKSPILPYGLVDHQQKQLNLPLNRLILI